MSLLFQFGFIEASWKDLIDIILFAFMLYQMYNLIKGTLAVRIFLGFLLIYIIYLLVKTLKMELLTLMLGEFMGVGVLAVIILFQQEIRKFLMLIGKSTAFEDNFWFNLFNKSKKTSKEYLDLSPIIDAVKTLGSTNTGALIVFAKSNDLKFYAESGDLIDAIISKRLLIAIFQKDSPLHDGALIIENNKIKAARCILPVSENDEIPANFGLRHRSAIGMTEVTDSVVLSVSEETGQVSIAYNGTLHSNLSRTEIREKLMNYLYDEKR